LFSSGDKLAGKFSSSLSSSDFRAGRGQVLFRRRGSEGDRRPNVLSFQAREIRQNFLDVISAGQAGEHRAKRNSRTPKHGFSAADLRIADDAFVEKVWHSDAPIIALMEAASRPIRFFGELQAELPNPQC